MTLQEAIEKRHSVRSYTDEPLSAQEIERLQQEIASYNVAGDLRIQLVHHEQEAFHSTLAHYGNFRNVQNYIALIGKEDDTLDERCGYYGEKLVLLATTMHLETCWVALTFKKRHVKKLLHLQPGEHLRCVIAIGHSETSGKPHTSKDLTQLYEATTALPDWFLAGVKTAQFAPTARNQQNFIFHFIEGHQVHAQALRGAYSTMDLGIVKYHFELGADCEIEWV